MANIYNITWSNVGKNLMFWRWRRNKNNKESKLLAYIRSIMGSIQILSDKLFALQQETVEYLQYNGQHKVLEEYLNNIYDIVQRRIYITENDIAQLEPVAIGLSGEVVQNEVVIGLVGDTITTPISLALSNEILESNNFTVNIPIAIVYDANVITAQLRNYVLAGKNFNIITY